MTDKEIVERINQAVYKDGRTQAELANCIGVATTTLNRFLTGRVTLGLNKVCDLCKILGIDILVKEDSEDGTDDEESDRRCLTKDQYRVKMLKLKGKPGGMEYDSKLYFAYQKLANAIIVMAVDDYREIRKYGNVKMKIGGSKYTSIDSIENFFRSDYYKQLTDLDGEYILRKLKEEQDD